MCVWYMMGIYPSDRYMMGMYDICTYIYIYGVYIWYIYMIWYIYIWHIYIYDVYIYIWYDIYMIYDIYIYTCITYDETSLYEYVSWLWVGTNTNMAIYGITAMCIYIYDMIFTYNNKYIYIYNIHTIVHKWRYNDCTTYLITWQWYWHSHGIINHTHTHHPSPTSLALLLQCCARPRPRFATGRRNALQRPAESGSQKEPRASQVYEMALKMDSLW